jgi:hypothetical protein
MRRRDEQFTLAGLIELDEAVIGPQARKTGRVKTLCTTEVACKPLGKSVDANLASASVEKHKRRCW